MTMTNLLNIASLVLGGVACLMACIAVHAWRRQRACCESLEASIAALRREIELVASISARTGRRVQRVEHGYSDVADRVDRVETRGSSGPTSLDQAIDWARGGGDSDKLMPQFGLSSGEAELVARLHGNKRGA